MSIPAKLIKGLSREQMREFNIINESIPLRDWFAGLAMQAMAAGEGAKMVAARDERYDETNWKEIVASNAYEFADAMMAQRKKNK